MNNFDLKKYLAEGKLNEEKYTPGSGWTKDFDYDGMLNLALTLDASSPMDLLLKVSDDLEDVNYHRENSYLTDAIDAIKDGDRAEAKIAINKFRKEINKTLNEDTIKERKTKSNKMKKSELKEMIKAAMLAEVEISEDVDMIPAEKLFALIARDLEFSPLAQDNVMLSKEDAIEIMRHVIAIEQSDISPEAALGEYIANGEFEEAGDIPGFEGTKDALDKLGLEEAEEEDVEDVEIDTEEEVDVDMEMDSDVEGIDVKQDADAELSGTVGDVQDNLEAALEAARKLGDEKLEDQIGNTLTFFTRAHVVKEGDVVKDESELGL